MTRLLGIDLGTSSVKAVVIDEQGSVLGVGMHEYPILTPQPGHAEQNPHEWWQASVVAVRQALDAAAQKGPDAIAGIGLSGQMHGAVLVDGAGQPIGHAVIWPDQRTVAEVAEIKERIGSARLSEVAGTLPATGFYGPTLLWLLHNDPVRLERCAACLMPKDYLRLRLTGEINSEASDAAATALFDIRARQWSAEIVRALGLPERVLPPVLEAYQIAGDLRPAAADELGLTAGIPVAAGCADQAAQAVGNGLLDPGIGSVTIGTGGQQFAPLAEPRADPRLHTFCHAAPGRWYLLGASLAAGLSLRWLRNTLGMAGDPAAYEKLAALAGEIPAGADGLLFLPYLVGERAPLMDPLARGGFVGLTLRHTPGHMARAIMEGVAYSMRHIFEIMTGLVPINELLASGNGLGSAVWRQIAADVLNRPLRLATAGERAGVGAALLGGIGAGIYRDFSDLPRAQATEITEPQHPAAYEAMYRLFVETYPALRPIMHRLSSPDGG